MGNLHRFFVSSFVSSGPGRSRARQLGLVPRPPTVPPMPVHDLAPAPSVALQEYERELQRLRALPATFAVEVEPNPVPILVKLRVVPAV